MIEPNVIASATFACMFQRYLECSNELQGVIRDMVEVANDPDVTQDESYAAVLTIAEVLFPNVKSW